MTKKTIFNLSAVITLSLLAAANAFGYGFNFNQEKKEINPDIQREVVVIVDDFAYNLDPETAAYNHDSQVLTSLYEGLFTFDPVTLEPVPALCTSYKISRDKKRWTFTMREDAVFSDGEKITSQTVKDSLMSTLANPDAQFASMLDCIQGAQAYRTGKGKAEDVRIDATDEGTLIIHLTEPAAHLSSILCLCAFSVKGKEGQYSGAFTLDSYDGKELHLVKNPKYYNADKVYIPGVKIIQSSDLQENAYMINTGKADWITGNVMRRDVLDDNIVHIDALFGTSYLFFKLVNSPWDNAEFRHALLEAIPYDKLRSRYILPATTLIYPLSGYPEVSGIDDYNAEDAKYLMDEARKNAGIPQDEVLPIVFAITDSDYYKELAQILKEAWAPLGVELTIQITTEQRYFFTIPDWDADLFSYSWIGDYADPLSFLELFKSDSSLNDSKYNCKEYDDYILQANRENDADQHYLLLSKAEQKLLDDSVIIPLSYSVSMQVIDTDLIGGWYSNALDIHPFQYLYFKEQQVNIPNLVMLTK